MCNGDVLTDARPRRAGRVPRRARRRGDDLAHAGRRPVARSASCPTRDDGEVDRVRREAAAGQGADQLDQRRHVRARAVGARPHPAAAQRVDRARDVPAHARGAGPAVRDARADAYWLDIGTPEKYLQAHADVLGGALGGRPRPARASARRASGCRATPTIDAERGSRRRCCSATAPSSSRARASRGSVLGAGAVVERGARVDALGAARRRRVVARQRECDRLGRRRRRGRSSRTRSRRDHTIVGADVDRCAAGAASRRARPRLAEPTAERPMKALVTGGAGFIGSTLVDRLLAEGCDVDVVDDLSTGSLANLADARAQPRPRVHRSTGSTSASPAARRSHRAPPARGDLPPRRAGRRARVGGAAGVRRRGQHPRLAQRVRGRARGGHAQGRVRGVGRHALRRARGACRCARGHPQRPMSPYGVSKKAAGDYLHYYREVHGLEYTALALANVYGPRQDPHGEAGVVAIFAGQAARAASAHDLRRRRADARLRVRRRRRRRVRARGREGRRAADEHRHRRRDERAASSTTRWRGSPGSSEPPNYGRPRAGELAALRARPGPRRDPPRLEAVDRRSTTASPRTARAAFRGQRRR